MLFKIAAVAVIAVVGYFFAMQYLDYRKQQEREFTQACDMLSRVLDDDLGSLPADELRRRGRLAEQCRQFLFDGTIPSKFSVPLEKR